MTHVYRTEPITLAEYDSFLRSWSGVPYMDCGMGRGGIDCLRFVVMVLDWLHGWDSKRLPEVPKLPRQTSLHDERSSIRVVHFVKARYPHEVVWRSRDESAHFQLRPGDCLVVRNQLLPGHAVIAGARTNTCWHSLNHPSLPNSGNVHETSFGWCLQIGVLEIFRPTTALLQC